MAKFTVRVELHHADEDDYEELHGYMEQQGFVRYIVDSEDAKWQLPTAEYNIASTGEKSAVLAKAEMAAKQTGKKYMVLVTKSNGRTWANLPGWKG